MSDWTDRLRLFDPEALPTVFSDPNRTTRGLTNERQHRSRAHRRRTLDARKQAAAADVLAQLPEPGETLHMVHVGLFDGTDLLRVAFDLAAPATCPHLRVVSLGVNDRTLSALVGLLDTGRVKTVSLLLSHYFRSVDQDLYARVHGELTRRGCRVGIGRVHAKVWCMPMTDDNAFVFEGSGNLRSCKSLEQIVIANNPEVAAFHAGWIDDLISEVCR